MNVVWKSTPLFLKRRKTLPVTVGGQDRFGEFDGEEVSSKTVDRQEIMASKESVAELKV